MRQRKRDAAADGYGPAEDNSDWYTSYESGDSLVVCDRENPTAWIRSDRTETLTR